MIRLLFALFLGLTSVACSGGSSNSGQGTVLSACVNVCSCFSRAAEINDCRDRCTSMSVSASIRAGRAFSGGSASFSYGLFWGSSGGSGSSKHVASGTCLTCLTNASCSTLEGGSACLSECQSLIPTHSS